MNMYPDNSFIENAKQIKDARTKVIRIIETVERRTEPGTARDSELLVTLALNGYSLLPIGSGVIAKAEWVLIIATGDGFEPSFVVSADPEDL